MFISEKIRIKAVTNIGVFYWWRYALMTTQMTSRILSVLDEGTNVKNTCYSVRRTVQE